VVTWLPTNLGFKWPSKWLATPRFGRCPSGVPDDTARIREISLLFRLMAQIACRTGGAHPGNAGLKVEDDQTHSKCVIVPTEAFQKWQARFFDDGEFDPREAYPLLDQMCGGPRVGARSEWNLITRTTHWRAGGIFEMASRRPD
jgi:hypothetical protein